MEIRGFGSFGQISIMLWIPGLERTEYKPQCYSPWIGTCILSRSPTVAEAEGFHAKGVVLPVADTAVLGLCRSRVSESERGLEWSTIQRPRIRSQSYD
jgi:hypothetical protein